MIFSRKTVVTPIVHTPTIVERDYLVTRIEREATQARLNADKFTPAWFAYDAVVSHCKDCMQANHLHAYLTQEVTTHLRMPYQSYDAHMISNARIRILSQYARQLGY